MDQNEKRARSEPASAPQAAPGQTIVIERRERVEAEIGVSFNCGLSLEAFAEVVIRERLPGRCSSATNTETQPLTLHGVNRGDAAQAAIGALRKKKGSPPEC
jgi:hypothetical protein